MRFKKNSVIFKKFENELACGFARVRHDAVSTGTRMSDVCVPAQKVRSLSQKNLLAVPVGASVYVLIHRKRRRLPSG